MRTRPEPIRSAENVPEDAPELIGAASVFLGDAHRLGRPPRSALSAVARTILPEVGGDSECDEAQQQPELCNWVASVDAILLGEVLSVKLNTHEFQVDTDDDFEVVDECDGTLSDALIISVHLRRRDPAAEIYPQHKTRGLAETHQMVSRQPAKRMADLKRLF